MIVAGVDSSLRSTGIAIIDPSVGVIETRNIKGPELPKQSTVEDRRDRIDAMHGRVMVVIEDVDLVVIEGLSFGSTGNVRDQLAGLWWSLVLSLKAMGVEVLVVTPQQRAKYATGSGGADKHDVLAAIRAEHPDADVPNHDVADAVALAAWGARSIGEPVDRDMEWRVGAEMKGMGA